MNQSPSSSARNASSSASPGNARNQVAATTPRTQEMEFINNPDVDMREQIIKRCIEWSPPIDYIEIKSLRLPEQVKDKNEWLLYTRRFEAYLRSHPFAYKFWKYGKYLLPAFIVMDDGLGNISTNRELVDEFRDAMDGLDSNQSSGQTAAKNLKMTCRLIRDHPLYDLLINNNSITNVTLMIEFYTKVMQFTLDVLRFTVGNNKQALNLLAAYDPDDVENLFKMTTEIDGQFSGACTAENRQRRYRFGNQFIGDLKCKSVDEFVAILYEERRWIYSIWHDDWRTDTEMLDALINGLSKSDKYAKIYSLLTLQHRPGQIVNFEQIIEQMRSFTRNSEYHELNREGRAKASDDGGNFRNQHKGVMVRNK